jgi:hypothetical protein
VTGDRDDAAAIGGERRTRSCAAYPSLAPAVGKLLMEQARDREARRSRAATRRSWCSSDADLDAAVGRNFLEVSGSGQ